MFEKRFYVESLAHASYLIGDSGQAAVVDPKRDVDDYLEAAEREDLRIVAILATHPHADFVSGQVELAQRSGATIYVSHLSPASYQREAVPNKHQAHYIRTMIENLPERPPYFSPVVQVNLAGDPMLGSLPALCALTEAELKAEFDRGAAVIDTRSAPFFGAGHFPGSLNIGLSSGLFSTWVGFLVPFGKPIALVVGSADSAAQARLELARIGYDKVIGYFEADLLTQTR